MARSSIRSTTASHMLEPIDSQDETVTEGDLNADSVSHRAAVQPRRPRLARNDIGSRGPNHQPSIFSIRTGTDASEPAWVAGAPKRLTCRSTRPSSRRDGPARGAAAGYDPGRSTEHRLDLASSATHRQSRSSTRAGGITSQDKPR